MQNIRYRYKAPPLWKEYSKQNLLTYLSSSTILESILLFSEHVHYSIISQKNHRKKHKNKTKKSACLKNLPPQQVLMFLPRCCTSAIRFSCHRWTPVMAVSRINCPAHAISSSRRFTWVFRVPPPREFWNRWALWTAAGVLLLLDLFNKKKGTLRSENLVKIVENLRNV